MNGVPKWNQLPSAAQQDLAQWKTWYGSNRTNDKARLTLLNVYVKLKTTKKTTDLWQYVQGPSGQRTGAGNVEFRATSVNALKTALGRRNDFLGPGKSPDEWEAREDKLIGSIHFKHNKNWGHAADEVQVHLDPFGLSRGPLLHWQTQEGYKDAHGIRNLLTEQGYDRSVLYGEPVVTPLRITVPTIRITGVKPLPKLRKIQPAVPAGIIPGEGIDDILKRWNLAKARKYVPLLKPHVPGVPPAFQHKPPLWKIPSRQTDPFPSRVQHLPIGQRQDWLRKYYQINPIAAQRAQNEARTIIKWAHTHLGSPSGSAMRDARQRHIPVGQTNPYPRQISRVPVGQRQAWLRTYYQVNPRAALQARNDARTIIKWAHTHLK